MPECVAGNLVLGKVQFHYNPETCNYEPVQVSLWQRAKKVGMYVLFALALAAGTIYTLSFYYPTPKEAELTTNIDDLELRWTVLQAELEAVNSIVESLWTRDEELRRILELDSLPLEIRTAGTGGSQDFADLNARVQFFDELINNAYRNLARVRAKMQVQQASYDTLLLYAIERDNFWASIPAIQPVENKDLRRLSTVYGMRLHPIFKKWMEHRGFDFMGTTGVPIYATGDGYVELAEMTHGGFGKLVIINHGYGYKTRYAHLDGFATSKGMKVKRGQLIGYMGNTGRSAGVHLHYEVLKNGVQVNPIGFFERELSEEAFAELLVVAKQPTIPLD